MNNKEHSFSSQESDGRNFNFYLSKMENELFDENKNKPNDIWNIKRKESKKNGISWFIFKNKELVLEIPDHRLSQKEKKFLNGSRGIIFLLTLAKDGLSSIAKLKNELKNNI